MKGISIFGGAALALAAMGVVASPYGVDLMERPRPRKHHPLRDPSPNDLGPVIDSTKESKRARRRRLAKEGR